MSNKRKVRVKVIGPSDFSVDNMFREYKSAFIEYVVMKDDIKSTPDLLCFTGGPDVSPHLYSEPRLSTTSISHGRDKEDISFFERYPNVPKVGICRGGQILNVLSGGKMFQHVTNHGRSHNIINMLPMGGRWAQGDLVKVTSSHHQMMIPHESAEVLAIAMDDAQTKGLSDVYLGGIARDTPPYDTEVVWYQKTKSLCFQPHPEYSGHNDNRKYFFDLIEHLIFPQ